jgi:hypothetical protein
MEKTVQLVPSIYSPSGWEVLRPDAGTMPELSERERDAMRAADRISFSSALKEFGLTRDQFETLQSLLPSIFPRVLGHIKSGGTLVNPLGTKTEATFSRQQFAAFFARLREISSWDNQ